MYLAYQCIDDISDLQPPDNDENADKHTKLSIEVYEDFPTLSRASRRYMVVEFNHHIQPTNPVKVESLPEHVATYHSNSHKKFKDEYRVGLDCTQENTQRNTRFFHSNFTLVTKSQFLLVSVIKTYFAIGLGTSQCVSAVLCYHSLSECTCVPQTITTGSSWSQYLDAATARMTSSMPATLM